MQNESNQCYQRADQNWSNCYYEAGVQAYFCFQNDAPEEEGICNQLWQQDNNSCDNAHDQDYYYCMSNSGSAQERCEFNFQMDQQACANDYDNCLFICSTQNP